MRQTYVQLLHLLALVLSAHSQQQAVKPAAAAQWVVRGDVGALEPLINNVVGRDAEKPGTGESCEEELQVSQIFDLSVSQILQIC